MKLLTCSLAVLLLHMISTLADASADTGEVTWYHPKVALTDVPFDVTVKIPDQTPDTAPPTLHIDDEVFPSTKGNDGFQFKDVKVANTKSEIKLLSEKGNVIATTSMTILPAWLSLLPSLVAIGFALLFRQVLPALFAGLWIGATLTYGAKLSSFWYGFLDVPAVYTLQALNDSGHLSIILFSLTIAGMVGIISKNGGTAGIVTRLISFANSRRRGQLSTAFLGTAIFFDDYANTMIVGNTMRPITDHLKISREKLAYIVDSTAAPIASIALVTTWIGFEVGLIDEAIRTIPEITESAYSIFLNSLAYSFYTIFALAFVYLVAMTGRDFGPMWSAERQAFLAAQETDEVSRLASEYDEEEASAHDPHEGKAINAVVPLLTLIVATFVGIYVTGSNAVKPDASLRDIVGAGDPYVSMIWGSALSVLVAAILTLGQRLLTLGELVDAWIGGAKSLLIAIVILTLAWALAGVNDTLHTADFLASSLSQSLSPVLLPLLIFVLSALMAFATGSSWGVMGIMVPLTIPLTWAVLTSHGLGLESIHILYASVAALLSGAVWGDHCSPISDTTILSSIASECDHIQHVRTQLPYAVFVALVATLVGTLPAGYGVPPLVSLTLGGLLLAAGLRFIGKKTSSEEEAPI